jgi:hypothetical protein
MKNKSNRSPSVTGKGCNMSIENNQEAPAGEAKQNDKEYNFRALEAKYQRQLEQERFEKEKYAKELEDMRQAKASKVVDIDEEDDGEPYVDKKKLYKTLSNFEKKVEEKIDKKAEEKARTLFDKQKQENWVRQNPDFYDVLQNHAEKIMEKHPHLAETILEMPNNFERQKLVYQNIKAFGLDKPEVKQPSIQEKIDSNKRSPYYQPSGVAAAPYSTSGDFSTAGQKNAYAKMKELQARLRM